MQISETIAQAFKNILASKTRSFLTMLGIIIGVAAVIVIVGLGNGMETYMTDSFASLGTNTISVNVTGRGSSRSVSVDEMYELVDENSTYLEAISPNVSMSGAVKIGSETLSSTTMSGVSEEYLSMRDYQVASGRALQYLDMTKRSKVCIIGSYLNREYFDGNGVGQSLKINGNTFSIVGVLAELDDSSEGSTDDCIYLPYTTAARLSYTGEISSYTITVVSTDTDAQNVAIIEDYLYDIFNDENAYSVTSMSEMLDTMTSMINAMIMILAAIAAISLVVGGIGIMNIMLVSVTERTKEIGIRKALGAKERYIMQQFVIEAATTSALGGVLGILIGYLLSAAATMLITGLLGESLTVSPSSGAILLAFGVSTGIGIVFGYLPAKKAARLNPIDALHYD